MITIACCFWDINEKSKDFSRCFDTTWVDKLYRGFDRNLTKPFRFVCFVDHLREFEENVQQHILRTQVPDYGCLIEPYKLGGPMIVCGLDTVVLENIDHLAAYCEQPGPIALPRNPYKKEQSINAIVLVPPGHTNIFADWSGENDMDWLRQFDWLAIDDLFPGNVRSLKAHRIRDTGPDGAKIIYFHGVPKPHELMHLKWIQDHWR